MIQNKNPTTYDTDVIIEGGIWNGNSGAQTSGHGIFWNQTTDASSFAHRQITIRHLKIQYCKQNGLHLSTLLGVNTNPQWFKVHDVWSNGHLGYGIYADRIGDSQFSECDFGSYGDTAIYVVAAAFLVFSNLKTDGQMIVRETSDITVNNFVFDLYNRNCHGIDLQGTRGSAFSNGRIHIGGSSTTNNYAAIYVQKTGTAVYQCSVHNVFSNMVVGRRYDFTDAHIWKYGVQEAEASAYVGYNAYTNINAYDVVTTGITFPAGTTSNANLCWNSTSWLS
jgi:hypothetical protein